MDFKSLFRRGILNTRPYVAGKPIEEVQREQGLPDVIKLASNENPDGPLPEVLEAIRAAAADVNRYPDSSCFTLTRALAAHLGVAPEALLLGNGSNEVVDLLIRALTSPGENVVCIRSDSWYARSIAVFQKVSPVAAANARKWPIM